MGTLAGGCASRPADRLSREPEVGAPSRAPSAAAVLAPESLGVLGGVDEAAVWDTTRRDLALNVRQPAPLLAADVWPQPEQPSLEEEWYIYLPRDPRTMVFFLPPYWWRGAPWR